MAIDDLIVPLAAAGGAVAALFIWGLYVRYYRATPPHRALVLFGRMSESASSDEAVRGEHASRAPRVLVGGGVFVPPWNKGFGYLPLNTLDAEVALRTSAGAARGPGSAWALRLGIQFKIPADGETLRIAAENLFAKSEEEIRALVRRVVAGCVPGVLARIHFAGVEEDWDRLAAEIQAAASSDLVAFGITVRSVSVQELRPFFAPDLEGPERASVLDTHPELIDSRTDPLARTRLLEIRLEQVERNLGIMGDEVVRLTREDRTPVSPRTPLLEDAREGGVPGARSDSRGWNNGPPGGGEHPSYESMGGRISNASEAPSVERPTVVQADEVRPLLRPKR